MAKGGMGNLMKQAQMMQANLQKAQSELANIDVQGTSGNGLIKITISCKHEIKKVDIDPVRRFDYGCFQRCIKQYRKYLFAKNGRLSSSGNEFTFLVLCRLTTSLKTL